MTTQTAVISAADDVNAKLANLLSEGVLALMAATEATPRALEEAVWNLILQVGCQLLTYLLGQLCRRASEQEANGQPVSYRMDADYRLSHTTTLGNLEVPLFAYREAGVTRAPARAAVFPLHPHCRSSELLLEWETKLGCQLPFRQAEEALEFFSHGAVTIEDTTIARHLGVVGGLVDRTWTCRTPEDVADILAKFAERDRSNGRPLLYISSDAHALRRYVDDTWKAEFKMLNGIRFWCVDKNTGQTIHLGGEYTWGDCRDVAERMRALVDLLVPRGERAPQVVFVTDGMPWIRTHLFPVMPEGTLFILDFYHLAERLSAYAATRFGAKTKEATVWTSRVVERLMGKRRYRRKVLKKRRGHTKRRRSRRDPCRTVHPSAGPHGAGDAFGVFSRLPDYLSYSCRT